MFNKCIPWKAFKKNNVKETKKKNELDNREKAITYKQFFTDILI